MVADDVPLHTSPTLSEGAQRKLIRRLLGGKVFGDPWIERRLAAYVGAPTEERHRLILELMNHLWRIPSSNQLFSVFRDFDILFSVLGNKGHFIHQFEVFLFGLFLILHILPLDTGSRLVSRTGSIEKLFYSWLLTSTAHDFGYPLQTAKALSKKLSALYKKIHMNNLSSRYRSIEKTYCLGNESGFLKLRVHDASRRRGYVLDIEQFISAGIRSSLNASKKDADEIQYILKGKENHGYISAIILCRSYIHYLSRLGIWNSSGEAWRIDALRMSASAIALHALSPDEENYIRRINFNSNPLAYLLLLVDNLQEWARAAPLSHKWPAYNLLDFEPKSNALELSYILHHENWTRPMIEEVRKSLARKAAIIRLPARPSPLLNFKLSIRFESNHDHQFDPINITI